ncbi:MAG: hypothetical protein M1816_003617 [Peltula sp. TS41687]|nr:MAG: hypothetical protein M1816_003617 [Peltula sp. TS41687]
MREDDMRALWDQINVIISTTNDILSIKKEIAQEQVDTLIPLLYLRHGSIQGAVDDAMEILHSSVEAFDSTSQRLLARHHQDEVVHNKLQKFIDGCKYACTGNLNWRSDIPIL